MTYKSLTVSEQDAAYMAGLIDGEGCIGIYKTCGSGKHRRVYPQYVMSLGMSNTHLGVIKWICQMFGGTYHIANSGAKNPKYSVAWSWKITARHAKWVLEQVIPYLRIKRDQAEIAIEFQNHVQDMSWVKGNGFARGVLPMPPEIFQHRQDLAAKLKSTKRSFQERRIG